MMSVALCSRGPSQAGDTRRNSLRTVINVVVNNLDAVNKVDANYTVYTTSRAGAGQHGIWPHIDLY